MNERSFDYIVVGAGAAGCVLASRLSENRTTRVALIEAGADVLPGREPADVADVYAASYFNKAYFWPGLTGKWRAQQTAPSASRRLASSAGAVRSWGWSRCAVCATTTSNGRPRVRTAGA